MESAVFVVQAGNGGAAVKAGNHASSKGAAPSGGAAAELPEGVSVSAFDLGKRYAFTQDGSNVVFFSTDGSPGNATIDFNVDGEVFLFDDRGETGRKIANKVSRIMKAEAASRPDGFGFNTSAITGDGLGQSRAALYGRAGFSLPSRPGKEQLAVVRNGKLVPSADGRTPYTATQMAKHKKDVREAVRAGAKARKAARRNGVSDPFAGMSVQELMRQAGVS